jgi:hypothetical protein
MITTHLRRDPGPCPICQAPHTICTAPGPASLVIPQLPARDAVQPVPLVLSTIDAPRLVDAEDVPPAVPAAVPERFSTSTYRRPKGRG